MTATGPGRSCPLHYRHDELEILDADTIRPDVAWIVGGLYGNPEALHAILTAVERDRAAGLHAALVFNGDFHWFDVNPAEFREIQACVLAEKALLGNIETELSAPDPAAGCGCAYPEFVDDATVAYSNQIIERLGSAARQVPGAIEALAQLPRVLRVEIGGCTTGVIHGDPESLAGWQFAIENVAGASASLATDTVRRWARAGAVDAFACTHTCLPWAATLGDTVVINNGSAGMPNFAGDPCSLVTRIAPSELGHEQALYTESRGAVCWQAVPVAFDHAAWQERFLRNWPSGSPAHASYARRIHEGPDFSPHHARPRLASNTG